MREFIAEHNLISEGQRIGAAVSGGADSIAMLHGLTALGFDVSVLHFEHGIRPEEASLGDMRFVEEYCRKHNLPFYCRRCSVPREKQPGESMESAARRLRYAFFEEMAEAHGLDRIATAHHADDAAETFFLNLLRGGGTTGLSGLRPMRGNIIRPMLFAARKEIEAYCTTENIPYVTDATNLSPDYTRNYLRLEVLPKLAQINPEYAAAILRTQDILREEDAALEAYAEAELGKIASFEEGRISLTLAEFNVLPTGMRRRILRSCLNENCPLTDIEKKHYDTLLSLCAAGKTGAKFALPGKFSAFVSYNTLIIAKKMYTIDRIEETSLNLSGETLSERGSFCCVPAESCVFGSGADFVQFFDGEALRGAAVRSRRQGDRFHPLGAGGSKKLKDWFIDQKIPAEQRDGIPIVARGSEVLWVVGYALSEEAKVRPDSHSVIKCEYKISRESGGI